ncbi:MAG: putative signal transducing protein [Planctomycetota bacterium]|jgi:hypothetical protein
MKKVYVAETIPDAHLVAGLLKREGIHTRIENEDLVGAYGEIPPVAGTSPTVYVLEDADYERALEILQKNVKGFKGPQEYRSIVEIVLVDHFWALVAAVAVIVLVSLILATAFN